VHVGIVELAVDLSCLDLTEGYLLLNIVEYHQEMLAFLGISRIVVGHSDNRAVVLHDYGREFERYA